MFKIYFEMAKVDKRRKVFTISMDENLKKNMFRNIDL
jgi:hypothetical protein